MFSVRGLFSFLVQSIILFFFLGSAYGGNVTFGPRITILNPYEDIDWASISQHKANLHTHTTQSDGNHSPQVVIDFYKSRGYSILALTDHNRCTWPWNNWNRDAETLGMVAIAGNEYSLHDHVNGLFLCYETNSTTVEQTLTEIMSQGGLAFINHPGRYWSLNNQGQIPENILQKYIGWYLDFPKEYLLGMEVFNSINRHPNDILLYDALLAELMPERPIWIFANDDMHQIQVGSMFFAGISWTVFPTNALDESVLYEALRKGCFYASTHGTRLDNPALWNHFSVPVITNIVHDPNAGTIQIVAVSSGVPLPEENYLWISMGQIIHVGAELDYRNTAGLTKYVRAQLEGISGTTFTNPFGIVYESGTLRVYMGPVDALYAGAKWRIQGEQTWHSHGDTLELAPGTYIIEFKRVSKYHTPSPILIVIQKDHETIITDMEGALYTYDESLRLPTFNPSARIILVFSFAIVGILTLTKTSLRLIRN